MIILLSPAKTLDFDAPLPWEDASTPRLQDRANILAKTLRRYSASDLGSLMKLSDRLASLNHGRYQSWQRDPEEALEARAALLAFDGDCYKDIPAEEYTAEDRAWAQDRLRILSGLYGVLRPLDQIQPYRLEMGTRLKTRSGTTLYDFWGDRITRALNRDVAALEDPPLIVNLASNEYFKSVQSRGLKAPVIQPQFKERRGDGLKVIAFFAKRARGAMTDDIIRRRVVDVEGLKSFDRFGYAFNAELSDDRSLVFTRDAQ